jgi:glycosyltransferase involved in cell wall biosynthesis
MTNNLPLLVSVIILSDDERKLKRTLQSVSDQTYPNLEIILLDNAEDDNVSFLCEAFQEGRSNVEYIRNQVKIHCSRQMQKAFHQGKGKYFLLLQAGDYPEPEFISRSVEALEKDSSVSLIRSETVIVSDSAEKLETWDYSYVENCPIDLVNSFAVLCENQDLSLGLSGVMRRSMIEKSLPLQEDDPALIFTFLLEISLYGRIKVIQEPLFYKEIDASPAEKKQVTGLSFSEMVLPFERYYPNIYHVVTIYTRLAQSFHDVSKKEELMAALEERYLPIIQQKIDHETKDFCERAFKAMIVMEKEDNSVLRSYFFDHLLKALSDIILANPNARQPKQLLKLAGTKYTTMIN